MIDCNKVINLFVLKLITKHFDLASINLIKMGKVIEFNQLICLINDCNNKVNLSVRIIYMQVVIIAIHKSKLIVNKNLKEMLIELSNNLKINIIVHLMELTLMQLMIRQLKN